MNPLKKKIKYSKNPFVHTAVLFFRKIRGYSKSIRKLSCIPLYHLLRLIPLRNQIVATTFQGRKYGDNTQFVLEEIHRIDPSIKLIWLRDTHYKFSVPDYIQVIPYFSYWKKTYAYATSKVWINTHRLEPNARKRKNQIFIETWHGGLGIKKLDGDVPKFRAMKNLMREVHQTSSLADLYISNSDHLTRIYRSAFDYQGKIWKVGYPKNDILFSEHKPFREKIRDFYNISNETKIFLYAPTFRDGVTLHGFDKTPYDIDFAQVAKALEQKFSGTWKILVRWHPVMIREMGNIHEVYNYKMIDATNYPDMQELILASDAFLSDYSSCIFDAAMTSIPCFTFATDFDAYKADRGVYYEMEELPFPYAKNNAELIRNIQNFDENDYTAKWNSFAKRTGLHETGHAAKDIAEVVVEFIKGNAKPLKEIPGEP